jgi:hypothetical protein
MIKGAVGAIRRTAHHSFKMQKLDGDDNLKTLSQEATEQKQSDVNHGQFYRSADLVAAVHKGAGGIFAGFRAAHALGRIFSGTFTATPTA